MKSLLEQELAETANENEEKEEQKIDTHEKTLQTMKEASGKRSTRKKRQIVEFQMSKHLKWGQVIPYKFDGRHSEFFVFSSTLFLQLELPIIFWVDFKKLFVSV